MRLNRGLYILGISLLFLLTGTASAGPEVVRRGETRVGVGHVKTAAEIEAFARDLEKRDPRAAKALREAVGKDVASSKEERAKYDEALRKMRDAKNDTDR